MNDDEITRLAMQYAEQEADSYDYDMYADPNTKRNIAVKSFANQAKPVLAWLLRTHCLVTREKLEQIYQNCCTVVGYFPERNLREISPLNKSIGQKMLLESLFGPYIHRKDE